MIDARAKTRRIELRQRIDRLFDGGFVTMVPRDDTSKWFVDGVEMTKDEAWRIAESEPCSITRVRVDATGREIPWNG